MPQRNTLQMKQTVQNNTQIIQDDAINIGELFSILKRRRKQVWITTLLITFLSLVYAFIIKPTYEVKAVMELAQIDKKPVQHLFDLKQKVEIIFEVGGKKVEFPYVSKLELPKKTKNIMIIKTQGRDNNTAQQKLQEVINYIVLLQDEELNSYIDIQKKRLNLVVEDINKNKQFIIKIKKNIKNYEDKLLNISEQDVALAGIYTIEIGKKQTELNNVTNKIYELKSTRSDFELSISPVSIQRAVIIGKVEVLDEPIKPNKKLMVIVAFITGLILSIFLALFLEFLRGIKEE